MQQNTQVLATKRPLSGLFRISMQCKCCILAFTIPPIWCYKTPRENGIFACEWTVVGFWGLFLRVNLRRKLYIYTAKYNFKHKLNQADHKQ